LQSRQIFKFGLLRKKDNKKNLKIRLVYNPNSNRSFSALLFLYQGPTILIPRLSAIKQRENYE